MAESHVELEFETKGCLVSLSGEVKIQYLHSYQSPSLARRLKDPNQSLLKACSNKQKNINSILDITGGWGIDSFILASRHKHVTIIEQNSLLVQANLHAILCLKDVKHLNEIGHRIRIINADALDYLSRSDSEHNPDCIYIDPMFPDHKSGAKPGKEMQILQKMTGNQNLEPSFDIALSQANKRVVVKRPLKAEFFSQQKPDFSYREKSVRFDVYLTS